jgi:hypothetical protein
LREAGAVQGERAERAPRQERRDYPPRRQASAPRDPFFDKPYEAANADAQPAWEAAAAVTPTRSGVSANIKSRKKVAALFKTGA